MSTTTPEPAAAGAAHKPPLLVADQIVKHYGSGGLFSRAAAPIQAVSGIDLTLNERTTLGIVGESGCGKSTLGRILVGLERPTSGEVRLRGQSLHDLHGAERKAARFEIQMMFQDSSSAFNPRMTIERIIEEPLKAQGEMNREQRQAAVRRLASDVGISVNQLGRYPRELSGGQRQRVGLARAIATGPGVVVADEPVAALDVSVRSQILNLMADMQDEHGLSYVMVSHDLTVVHFIADHVLVMYLGQVVESGGPDELFHRPAHHYTRALIDAVPEPSPELASVPVQTISGELPSASAPPSGCRFRTRCPAAQPLCAEVQPPLRRFGERHSAACHFPLIKPLEEEPTK
jgi:peptide/nickel transport system ATP-binding protein